MPTILLVEDNPDTVEFLSRRLRDRGYEVLIARNGLDALRIAEAELPAAIVLDVNLPLLDGDEVARRLRGQTATRDIPMVFVTAESETRVMDLLRPHHTLCLEKAIRSQMLLDALAQVLSPPA
ncbi:MAG: response regulator [Candidatus Sericytochromatia bacterium]|nr:response regulator [Candidatus Sericytochromatia bacterium]